jgi:hypothetical protein
MMAWVRRTLLLVLIAWLAAFAPALAQEASNGQVLMLLKLQPEHFRSDSNYAGSYGAGAARKARHRIADRIAHANGLEVATSWPMPLLGLDCFVLNVPAGRSPAEVVAKLARDPAVAWSEPMHVYRAEGQAAAPNDPLFAVQPAAREWRLAELHEVATGRNVRVAVVDSAVDPSHPDLAGQFQSRRNFVPDHPDTPELHGTGVAGVIAAVADNHVGIVGVAPGARLMALRACWQQGGASTICNTLSLAEALHFAIDHDAQVINLSLSGPPDQLLGGLIDAALARGIVVVGAADPNLAGGGFPASHPGVVAVSNSDGAVRGAFVAPGRDVPTTEPGGRWGLVNGSSYSAAHVSGLAALVRERSPRERGPMTLVTAQAGAIDACATLSRGAAPCSRCACQQTARSSATAAPAR